MNVSHHLFGPIFGPIYPIFRAILVVAAVFFLSRFGLVVWQYDRIHDLSSVQQILTSGLRVDISSICYLFILPAFLSALLSGNHAIGRCWQWVLRLWITLAVCFVVFMEITTPAFIIEYDLRPNRIFAEYLIYPNEVMAMLVEGYKLEMAIALGGSILCLFYIWRASKRWIEATVHTAWYWRPVFAVLVLVCGVAGARSSFGHRPLNPAMVFFSSDPLVNDLTLNSGYSLLFAIKQMQSEVSALSLYPKMDEAEVIAIVKNNMNLPMQDFIPSTTQPILAKHTASFQGKPKNIVILLLESHGAQFVQSLGGINVSPNLDKFYQQGWGFTNAYATGTRSVRGIEALTTGFVPTPARAVVKLNKSQTDFFSIADVLKDNGYATQFVYGGESHFDNMKSFFLGNGFTHIQDLPTFDSVKFLGSWGASDQDLYHKAATEFEQFHQQGKPFFSLVFTSSNHSPFQYPDNVITPFNAPKQTVENAVKYADAALGEFIERAKQSAYWDETIFLVVADHDARTYGSSPVPIKHFQIPAVILGGGITPKQDARLISQIDLPPTLLSLAGIDSINPMIGFDLTQQVPADLQRALMQRDKNYAWMNAKNDVVVIRPEFGVTTYQYDKASHEMMQKDLTKDEIEKATAFALWGSIAYERDYYQALQNYKL